MSVVDNRSPRRTRLRQYCRRPYGLVRKSYSDARLPELFCGFSRDQLTAPVPYPSACSPPAWAATAPIQLVTSLMRYDPVISACGVWMDPALPTSFGDLHITNAPLGEGRISIDIANSIPTVHGLPEGMVLHQGHRPWMTEMVEQADMRRTVARPHDGPPPAG